MYQKCFKRMLDIVIVLIALPLLMPVLLLLTLIGAVSMRGNPFFVQERPGKDEKIFKLLKFRTMTHCRDENGQLLPDAQRLTKYGKFLRASSLDELPQLINILLGQMSLVGPRPLLPEFLPYYTKEEQRRHCVRPGLTGLAQVSGRNFLGWDARFLLDVQYVDQLSLWLDIKILLLTVKKVLCRSDVAVDTAGVEESLIESRCKRLGEECCAADAGTCQAEKEHV